MSAPTVVLIPGHLCDARLYAPQRPRLEARAPVRVAEVGADDGLDAMADRLLAETSGPLALVGLSMGGMVAMAAMARAPERVVAAALLDTDPTPARPQEIAWRAEQTARVAAEGLEPYVARFVAGFFGHDPAAAARLTGPVGAMMRATPEAVFAAQSRALDARADHRVAVAEFAGPVAVIWGAEDRVTPPIVHREIAAAPNAVATAIPGCGHLSTLEAPDAVGAVLDAWLARF